MGIIMLTARTQEAEKVSALQMGADDYVTKPFGTAELIARIDALYRRLSGGGQTVATQMKCGDFLLDLRTRQLLVGGVPVELTHVEYQIMEYFLRHTGEEVSRADILHAVWGPDYFGEDKIVDVNMHRLRMKVEADPSEPKHIITVWGRGYKWNG
jgi:DNA-binding response OmpR family regulator